MLVNPQTKCPRCARSPAVVAGCKSPSCPSAEVVTDDALRIYAIGVDTLRSRDVLALVPTWSELTTVFPSLDSKTHTLYFQPLAGLDLKNAVVEATRLRTLVEFRGDEANPAKWITLRGLTFRHAERTVRDNHEPLMRSDWTIYRGSAVFFNGAEDCALTDSFIDQSAAMRSSSTITTAASRFAARRSPRRVRTGFVSSAIRRRRAARCSTITTRKTSKD